MSCSEMALHTGQLMKALKMLGWDCNIKDDRSKCIIFPVPGKYKIDSSSLQETTA
jgi:hypothetical protein